MYEIHAKLFVQGELNTTIVLSNFIHLKLVVRHLPKGIEECFDTLQQFIAATLDEILRNVACEGVCEGDKLDAGL